MSKIFFLIREAVFPLILQLLWAKQSRRHHFKKELKIGTDKLCLGSLELDFETNKSPFELKIKL